MFFSKIKIHQKVKTSLFLALLGFGFLFLVPLAFATDNGNCSIGSTAWSEKAGFISFNGDGSSSTYGVTVSASSLTGYAWGDKTGWIHMSGTYTGGGTYGVLNDGTGKLSGTAWSEKAGFISFTGADLTYLNTSATNYGVYIDGSSNFQGYAWGDKTGWIHMAGTYTGGGTYGVTTTGAFESIAPVTAITTSRNGNTINATLTCSDSSGSGCSATYYCVDTEGTCTPTTVYATAFSFIISTNTWVRYYSVDLVSNTAGTSTSDTIGPTGGSGPSSASPAGEATAGQGQEEAPITPQEQPAPTPIVEQIAQAPQIIADQIIQITQQLAKTPQQLVLNIQKISQQVTSVSQQIAELIVSPFGKQQGMPGLGPLAEAVPEETPFAFQKKEELLPTEPIKQFTVSPLPSELTFFTEKFIGLKKTLEELGISKISDITKLGNTNLRLPGLTEAAQLAAGEIKRGAMPATEGIPVSKLSLYEKQKIPSEIVFARTIGELIDFNIVLSISDKGELGQRITTISGKPLELVVKPDKPVDKIKGYLAFKKNETQSGFLQYIFEKLPASLSSAALGLSEAENQIGKFEQKLVLQEFEYTDFDKDGIYTATINSPVIEGEYEIMTVMDYKDPELALKEIHLVVVVDPEGYVYTQLAEGKLRIEKAAISLYWLNPETRKYELWPARKYSQNNPQITDDTGKYSFLVPEGTYYIKVEAKNYFVKQTEPFSVIENGGVHMNIELTKKSLWQSVKNWILSVFNYAR